MPVYAYKGVGVGGRAMRGHVDAENLRAARQKLRRDGIVPTEVSEGGPAKSGSGAGVSGRGLSMSITLPSFRRIPGADLALATRQLATLVGAGVPLVSAIGAVSEQVENDKLKSVLGGVRDRVNEGAALADAMAQAGPFSDLYCGMVRAGEAGGALEQVLARLADYLESQERLRGKVISILAYPLFMLGFALLVVAALVTFVLPQITELLASLNAELPLYTQVIIGGANLGRDYWWAFGGGGLVLFLLLRAYVRTEAGRDVYDRLTLRIPVLGHTLRQIALSRFTRTLSTLLAGGLPITRALDISARVTNNGVLARAIEHARESVTEGAALAAPLRASGQFPPLVTHMVEVGEQSGELEAMLAKVAESYDEQVETAVQRFTALLEPLLILIMVGIVLVIILATLVPLLEVTSSLS